MTYREAVQSAIDVQDASNASGVVHSLASIMELLWEEARRLGEGTRWVNSHPAIALYLFKLGEMNHHGITSLMDGYELAENECKGILNTYKVEVEG